MLRKGPGPDAYSLIPIGGGPEKSLQTGSLEILKIVWNRSLGVLALARSGQDSPRLWKLGIYHAPRASSPALPRESFGFLLPRPDGHEAIVGVREGASVRVNLDDPAQPPVESPLRWVPQEAWSPSVEGEHCFVIRPGALPVQVERINLKTGAKETVRRIDFPGINGRLYGAAISENGKTVVLNLLINSSDLFVVDGLK